jgi:hypothetical protein
VLALGRSEIRCLLQAHDDRDLQPLRGIQTCAPRRSPTSSVHPAHVEPGRLAYGASQGRGGSESPKGSFPA